MNLRDKKNTSNFSMTKCSKGGIKIKDTGNNKVADPFAGVNPFNIRSEVTNTPSYNKNNYEMIDLNIDNYSREDLFKLFGISNCSITENIMKECKKIVLKTHPDKSKLDEKYFIFFSKAYKKLLNIYDFQNKINSKKTTDNTDYFNDDNKIILDKVFEKNKNLSNTKNFNSWFNNMFETHKLEEQNETGYGEWLKSDQDIVYTPAITKSNMASEMEKRKKEVQSLTTYSGVKEHVSAPKSGCSSLMAYDDNFTSGSLFSGAGIGYTDLRQAYVESVIPVTEEDYHKMKTFNNIDEYRRHRDSVKITPLGKEEAMLQLYQENKIKDEESAALAFYYANQQEKSMKKSADFWSGLKQLSN